MSNDPRHRRGAACERLAADYLAARGLTPLERNLRCRAGEIDLVCLDGDVLAIVEVRQRARRDFGGAPASVDRRKQAKIIRATQYFWQRRPQWRRHALRFDVIAVEGPSPEDAAILWLKDAFRA